MNMDTKPTIETVLERIQEFRAESKQQFAELTHAVTKQGQDIADLRQEVSKQGQELASLKQEVSELRKDTRSVERQFRLLIERDMRRELDLRDLDERVL